MANATVPSPVFSSSTVNSTIPTTASSFFQSAVQSSMYANIWYNLPPIPAPEMTSLGGAGSDMPATTTSNTPFMFPNMDLLSQAAQSMYNQSQTVLQ